MQDKQARLQQRLQPEIEALRAQCRSLMLATLDEQGAPNVSYAPFVFLDGHYYVLVSEVARHGRNLKAVAKASLMLIEDEADSRQLYARVRLSHDAEVSQIARDSEHWNQAVDALTQRHGDLVTNLTRMADFSLFRLTPLQGLYVKGFGQAFEVSGDDQLDMVHLTVGHKPMEQSDR